MGIETFFNQNHNGILADHALIGGPVQGQTDEGCSCHWKRNSSLCWRGHLHRVFRFFARKIDAHVDFGLNLEVGLHGFWVPVGKAEQAVMHETITFDYITKY